MPALSFKSEFAKPVKIGLIDPTNPVAKRQTIRALRKNPFKPGDRLYFYTGMRTKACRKLGEAECVSADEISISYDGICVDGVKLNMEEAMLMARADGFDRLISLYRWFHKTHGLPFFGQLIKW